MHKPLGPQLRPEWIDLDTFPQRVEKPESFFFSLLSGAREHPSDPLKVKVKTFHRNGLLPLSG